MKGGMMLLAGAISAAGLMLICPQSIRDDVAERTTLPDHVYAEAGRQLSLFVNWARQGDERPATEDSVEISI